MENVVLWGRKFHVSWFYLRQKIPVVILNALYFITWPVSSLLSLIRIRFEAKSYNRIRMLKIFWPVLRIRNPVLFLIWSRINKIFGLKILKLFANWLKSFTSPVQKLIIFSFLQCMATRKGSTTIIFFPSLLVVVLSGIQDPSSRMEPGSGINNPDSQHCPWPINTWKVP